MPKIYHFYLLRIQFLGFRYSGWQVQTEQKTVEGMILKTLKFILPNRKFKILGTGRTDAKVSVLDGAFELFLEGRALVDKNDFLITLNKNLPPDIKVVDIIDTNENFNIIKDVILKEYVYLFSFGEKSYPFAAPFITNIQEDLNIELMKSASGLFTGNHDFTAYTVKSGRSKDNFRTIEHCSISENDILTANFFPTTSYALRIKGQGFVRYQVRMIMGALIKLGKGELNLTKIEASLISGNEVQFSYIAPGSGLLLNKIDFAKS